MPFVIDAMGSLIVSRFDTQFIFARDIDKMDTILQVWLDNCDIAKPKANVSSIRAVCNHIVGCF